MDLSTIINGVGTEYVAEGSILLIKKSFKKVTEFLSPKNFSRKAGQVSAGLAIGYYFNFIKPIADELERGQITLKIGSEEKKKSFKADNVKIKIILPLMLDGSVFERCRKELENSSKATLDLKSQSRPYPVFFDIIKKTKKEELVIVDYARPAAVVKFYYEEVLKINTSADNKKWFNAQEKEIETFKKIIHEMIGKGYNSLANKVEFQLIK